MGRRAGLPILDGFAVESDASRHHLQLGAAALKTRGSGGARLAITNEPLADAARIVEAGEKLGTRLVARSSTTLEASNVWSGAFTSYVDISPRELPKAVTGCWASAFSVDSLERQNAIGVEPGSFPMSVLVQSALEPAAGGTARVDPSGGITVHGVEGSPSPLLQGFVPGHKAVRNGGWAGDELLDLLGSQALDELARAVEAAFAGTGADSCEWAMDGRIWILQLGRAGRQRAAKPKLSGIDTAHPALLGLVRALATAPGPLGEELVVPWALGGAPLPFTSSPIRAPNPLDEAVEMSDRLLSAVWGMPASVARVEAGRVLSALRGTDPESVYTEMRQLSAPDPRTVIRLMGVLENLRETLVQLGVARNPAAAWHVTTHQARRALAGETVKISERLGIGRWEPLLTDVALGAGQVSQGAPASPGLGTGILSWIEEPSEAARFAPRSVLGSPHPVPPLAPLLWDAAAVITETGSPAAHFFESSRSLRVPAVCGVNIDRAGALLLAVDGYEGTVTTLDLEVEHV